MPVTAARRATIDALFDRFASAAVSRRGVRTIALVPAFVFLRDWIAYRRVIGARPSGKRRPSRPSHAA